ncbi:retrovirus-related pol polyprotein from transposon TNT 1-94 [Tanacetum coccineum]
MAPLFRTLCEKEKHHKASFKTKRSFSINKFLHLLHMDLFGPVKPQTISHNKYTLAIVDEYSRKMINLNEVRVKKMRSDNGKEFRNHKLEEFYDENGYLRISHLLVPLNKIVSIIVKRHGKIAYDVFKGRSLDISYFYVFGCPVYIHNHKDHLGKFDEKADDGFFLGYSLVAKAFRVFNIRRQEMEETVHVTFKPPEFTVADDHPTLIELDQPESADNLKPTEIQDNVIMEPISDVQPSLIISPLAEGILQPPVSQDRWSI